MRKNAKDYTAIYLLKSLNKKLLRRAVKNGRSATKELEQILIQVLG